MAQTATQIAQDAIAAVASSTSEVTNFNVGSALRSLVDAFSAEAAVIEQQLEDLVSTAAQNAVYQLMDITPGTAVGSTYVLTFTLASAATSSLTLAAGTAATIPNSTLQWLTGQSITIAPGSSATTTAACSTSGSITNVPANSITQLVSPVANLTVTNASAQPTVAGRDAPTQTELQAQLSQQTNKLHRGDPSAVETGALSSQLTDASGNPTEQVVKALEVDYIAGSGVCYVYNGTGAMSTTLLTQTQNIINGYVDTNGVVHIGYKAAGVYMTAIDAPESITNVSILVLPKYGYALSTLQGPIQLAVNAFFDNLDLGATFSVSQLAFAILAVPGVADVQITSPSASLAAVPYVAVPSTPALTAVTPTTATTLAAGTYDVAVTFTNLWGETTASAVSSVTLTSGQAVDVATITLVTGATGVRYYMSEAAGSTTILYDAQGTGAATTLTTLPLSGASAPPTSNTAQIQGNAYVLGTLTIGALA